MNHQVLLRADFGRSAIALIAFMANYCQVNGLPTSHVTVVYVDTGWSSAGWSAHVAACVNYIQKLGFQYHCIKPVSDFTDLVRQRGAFPSQKFQWCATLLKGMPVLAWLDEIDLDSTWVVAIAKQRAQSRQPVPEWIEECPFHGERRVWHPLWQHTAEDIAQLLADVPITRIPDYSQACHPCVHHRATPLSLAQTDKERLNSLEKEIQQVFFVGYQKNHPLDYDGGCGMPYGCGL